MTIQRLAALMGEEDESGRYVLYTDHAAALAKSEQRVRELIERNSKWRSAFEGARDCILHERGQLEGYGTDSDTINAVLGILDDEFSEVIPLPVPSPAQKGEE